MSDSPDPQQQEKYPLLNRLNQPADVKGLNDDELEQLSEEIRQRIIEVASTNGGHLASPLGAVELAVAIHYIYDSGRDKIIWDVGHQAHAHKILTDRKDRINTIRRKGGISGYPSPAESPYDAFGTGHSSTSISAGLGMAVARDFNKDDFNVIAVIGDGAMTGGMAIEGLSNAGDIRSKLLVVLNDNKMSISHNVGAISSLLNRLITGGLYNRAKGDLKSFMEHAVGHYMTDAARKIENSVKRFLIPGAFFEELGFRYFGPVDGNDLHTMIECFRNLKDLEGPVLFHCVTTKGKGYPYAEEDPLTYHGVKPYDIPTGEFRSSSKQTAERAPATRHAVSFTDAFADALIEAARTDDKIVGITAGMPTGTGLSKFEKEFPDRFFDVGICEQHAVTFSAGLAMQGYRPVAAIYSTFLQRGYDQYIHDVCLQNLPVVFAIDRGGLVGEDSPTQQGAFDLSFLRAIPNVSVMVPRDNVDLRLAIHWAIGQTGPVAIRYPRCIGPAIGDVEPREITRAQFLRRGDDAYLVGLGPVVETCLQVAETLESDGISVGVLDARWVKPLDVSAIESIAHLPLITIEENTLEGGFGSAVLEHFEKTDRLQDLRIRRVGIPDRFLPHMTRNEQLEYCGLDIVSLSRTAREFLGQEIPVRRAGP